MDLELQKSSTLNDCRDLLSRHYGSTTKTPTTTTRNPNSTKNIARQSMGYSYVDQGLRLKSLIDDITISHIIEDKLYKMWGWFTTFGSCISGLLGILFIWRAISILIKTSINMTIL